MRAAAPIMRSLLGVSAPDVLADDLTGQASIIDGDTLEVRGTRVRLWGIDASESDQLCRNQGSEHYRCGQKAANDLDVALPHLRKNRRNARELSRTAIATLRSDRYAEAGRRGARQIQQGSRGK